MNSRYTGADIAQSQFYQLPKFLMQGVGKGGVIIMAPSEAQKKASAKWDKENMSTLGCKVKKEEAAAFKEYSQKRGKTSNTVLKEYVIQCIESDNGKAGD